jgi:hypothetical protein
VVDGSDFRGALSAQLLRGLLFLALKMGMYDMRVVRNALAISISILCTGLAHADWQYTKWGMSPEQLLAIGNGNIGKASPRESSPNVTEFQGKRGTTMAVNADLVMISGFSAEGMTYNALYYFSATGLFLVALIPQSIDDGFKTSKLLDATYGTSDREERMGLNENYSGCIARRRWRAPRDGNLVTFFNLCGTRFGVRYEPLPTKGGL